MDNWVIYGLIAAFFIATRDMFTKNFTKKYSITEHLIYYYSLTGFFIFVYAFIKKYNYNEKIRMIQTDDIWKSHAVNLLRKKPHVRFVCDFWPIAVFLFCRSFILQLFCSCVGTSLSDFVLRSSRSEKSPE